MPATPKVGRATSTSSRAAAIVRSTTMKGGASRPPGYLALNPVRGGEAARNKP